MSYEPYPGMTRLRTLLLMAAVAVGPAPLLAQDNSGLTGAAGAATEAHLAAMPLLHTMRIAAAIHLDGKLDEAAWQEVAPATQFTQTEPHEGEPATDRTEVRILFDADALYIGARMWDASGHVSSRLGRRDSYLSDSDWLDVMLDTYHDHVTSVQFSVNPAGVQRDQVGRSTSWDAVWDAATSVDADGWTAELRIPFSQLRFNHEDVQIWGLQLSRRTVSKQEVTVLSFTPKSQRGGVARYGHLVGLQGIRPGRPLELLPYALTRAEYLNVDPADPFRAGARMFTGAGLDLKYRLTSSMTMNATFNPDFGQVEVDPAVVNLSAFETSFDEKRPFFTEGSDVFHFNDLRLFYSRRIGRQPQGSAPDEVAFAHKPDNSTILGAAKVTGHTASGWNVGLLEAVTAAEQASWQDYNGVFGETPVEPPTNYLVARATRDLRQGQTRLGGIVTAVNRSLGDTLLASLLRASAFSAGADFSHEFAQRSWTLSGYFSLSHVQGSPSAMARAQLSSARYYQRPDADYVTLDSSRTMLEGYAARLAIEKNAGEHWRGSAHIAAMSPGFEVNDLGFETSADRVGGEAELQWVENRPGPLFRNYRIELHGSGDRNFGGVGVSRRGQLNLQGQLANYWGGHINYTHAFSTFDDRLTRGGPLARNLADDRLEIQLNSDDRRWASGRVQFNWMQAVSGSWQRSLSGNLTVRPGSNWTVSAGPKLNRSRTAAQYLGTVEDAANTATFGRDYLFAPIEQTTVSMETRLNVTFTPDLSFELYAQPFIATGDYGATMRLLAPRQFAFEPWTGSDAGSDFNTRSLRGNAVLRWQWRPGSTLFVVWQQRRSDSIEQGRLDFGRDSRALFDTRPSNVFLVKLNYWLNL